MMKIEIHFLKLLNSVIFQFLQIFKFLTSLLEFADL